MNFVHLVPKMAQGLCALMAGAQPASARVGTDAHRHVAVHAEGAGDGQAQAALAGQLAGLLVSYGKAVVRQVRHVERIAGGFCAAREKVRTAREARSEAEAEAVRHWRASIRSCGDEHCSSGSAAGGTGRAASVLELAGCGCKDAGGAGEGSGLAEGGEGRGDGGACGKLDGGGACGKLDGDGACGGGGGGDGSGGTGETAPVQVFRSAIMRYIEALGQYADSVTHVVQEVRALDRLVEKLAVPAFTGWLLSALTGRARRGGGPPVADPAAAAALRGGLGHVVEVVCRTAAARLAAVEMLVNAAAGPEMSFPSQSEVSPGHPGAQPAASAVRLAREEHDGPVLTLLDHMRRSCVYPMERALLWAVQLPPLLYGALPRAAVVPPLPRGGGMAYLFGLAVRLMARCTVGEAVQQASGGAGGGDRAGGVAGAAGVPPLALGQHLVVTEAGGGKAGRKGAASEAGGLMAAAPLSWRPEVLCPAAAAWLDVLLRLAAREDTAGDMAGWLGAGAAARGFGSAGAARGVADTCAAQFHDSVRSLGAVFVSLGMAAEAGLLGRLQVAAEAAARAMAAAVPAMAAAPAGPGAAADASGQAAAAGGAPRSAGVGAGGGDGAGHRALGAGEAGSSEAVGEAEAGQSAAASGERAAAAATGARSAAYGGDGAGHSSWAAAGAGGAEAQAVRLQKQRKKALDAFSRQARELLVEFGSLASSPHTLLGLRAPISSTLVGSGNGNGGVQLGRSGRSKKCSKGGRAGGGGGGGSKPEAGEVGVPLPATAPRACSNPWCINLEGACEQELWLRKCGGCGAVRYCCRGCQQAHWRAGHREECKQVQRQG